MAKNKVPATKLRTELDDADASPKPTKARKRTTLTKSGSKEVSGAQWLFRINISTGLQLG